MQTLKIWPDDLEEIRTRRKKSEVRRCDDRKFTAGEELELQGYDPQLRIFVGRPLRVRVTHVESMAGPAVLYARSGATSFPIVVLSIEVT
jgi:hypothetical protein